MCVAVSQNRWLLLRQARFCAWPPLVLSLRPYAYRRCLPLRTLTSLCLSASLLRTSTMVIFGNGFWYCRAFSTFSLLFFFLSFYLFIFLFPSRLSPFLGLGVISRSMVEEDRRGPLSPVERHIEKIYWPLRIDDTHSSRSVVSFLGGPETSFWWIPTRSTWQNRCVLCGCASVGIMRHAFHLAQILRAQATRSQVSSRSLVTASDFCVLRPSVPKCPPAQSQPTVAEISLFRVFSDFFELFQLGKVQNFPASFSSSECHPAQQPTCQSRLALVSTSLRSVFRLPFLRGF